MNKRVDVGRRVKVESTTNFALTIHDGSATEVIEWPVVRGTDKALLVASPGGEFWLPLWRFHRRRWPAQQVGQLIRILTDITSSSRDSVTRVWKAGPGPTRKSHRFQVAVKSYDPERGPHVKIRRRSFILPVSQIDGSRGSWSAPTWLVKKRLGEGESLANSHWPGIRMVAGQLTEAAQRASRSAAAVAEAELQRRRLLEEENVGRAMDEALEIDRLVRSVMHEGELALTYLRKNFTLAKLAAAGLPLGYWPTWPPEFNLRDLGVAERILLLARAQPKFEAWSARNAGKDLSPKPRKKKAKAPDQILENVRVQWVDWGGTSKNRIRIEKDEQNCTVKFFGSKREITTPGGDVIIKMRGPNLHIHR